MFLRLLLFQAVQRALIVIQFREFRVDQAPFFISQGSLVARVSQLVDPIIEIDVFQCLSFTQEAIFMHIQVESLLHCVVADKAKTVDCHLVNQLLGAYAFSSPCFSLSISSFTAAPIGSAIFFNAFLQTFALYKKLITSSLKISKSSQDSR